MHCTELRRVVLVGALALTAACGNGDKRDKQPARVLPPADSVVSPPAVGALQPRPQPLALSRPLPPPATPRSMQDLQLQFARRLVAAHPDTTYSGRAPDRLLAIPVLEVELNADGSVRRIDVLRRPTTSSDATALAIAAVRRAAPYGDVSRLPRPWKVVETFLFDDRLRFKPRTLDID